jgi:hypothetical protein
VATVIRSMEGDDCEVKSAYRGDGEDEDGRLMTVR